MNIKKSLLSVALIASCLTAAAQDEQPQKTENVFNKHWYVQAQGGAQYTLGEIDFSDLISGNAQVGVGYQFSPVFGARLSVNAWQSKAGSRIDGFGDLKWKWNYIAPNVDVTFNFSNLFFGFKPDRVFSFSMFAGLGANIGFKNDQACCSLTALESTPYIGADGSVLYPYANSGLMEYLWSGTKVRVQGRAGMMFDFRVSDKVSLGLELQATTLSDRYNSKRAQNWDWYFNALAGIKVNLGKTHTTKQVPACPCPPKVVEKVVERVVEKAVPAPAPAPAVAAVAKKETMKREVFFTINSVSIPKAEQKKVADIANFLKDNPNAKVTVTGYADKGTGNAKINNRLASNRANTVVKALKTQYGIDASRITCISKGDSEQPFAENDKNRVSICIAE